MSKAKCNSRPPFYFRPRFVKPRQEHKCLGCGLLKRITQFLPHAADFGDRHKRRRHADGEHRATIEPETSTSDGAAFRGVE
jgi:hypothetical protein